MNAVAVRGFLCSEPLFERGTIGLHRHSVESDRDAPIVDAGDLLVEDLHVSFGGRSESGHHGGRLDGGGGGWHRRRSGLLHNDRRRLFAANQIAGPTPSVVDPHAQQAEREDP